MSEIKDLELQGKHVILTESAMAAEYRDITWRTVQAKGGFGCTPGLSGTAVFVEYVRDGDRGRFSRNQIERLATDEEVQAAIAAGKA